MQSAANRYEFLKPGGHGNPACGTLAQHNEVHPGDGLAGSVTYGIPSNADSAVATLCRTGTTRHIS